MRVAITGGAGFVGRDLATRLLAAGGFDVIVLSRNPQPMDGVTTLSADMDNVANLRSAFRSCDAVAHCAGINRETDKQTYRKVHVEGTANVVNACRAEGVRRLVLTSFLRARPDSGSPYHESKWQAEQIVRSCDLDYTILKPGVIFGKGDHMLGHMSKALRMSPVFGLIGADVSLRPIALADFTQVMIASLTDPRLSRGSFAVLGAEELRLSEAARRVAAIIKRPVLPLVMPLYFVQALSLLMERTMKEPLLAASQVTMIAEGLAQGLSSDLELPEDLKPQLPFSGAYLKQALLER